MSEQELLRIRFGIRVEQQPLAAPAGIEKTPVGENVVRLKEVVFFQRIEGEIHEPAGFCNARVNDVFYLHLAPDGTMTMQLKLRAGGQFYSTEAAEHA